MGLLSIHQQMVIFLRQGFATEGVAPSLEEFSLVFIEQTTALNTFTYIIFWHMEF